MPLITCPECGEQTNVDATEKECPRCYAVLSAKDMETEQPSAAGKIISELTLTHARTKQVIDVTSFPTTLGREGAGIEVLKTILSDGRPVISRKHCTIRVVDGNAYVRDDNSMNGTFVGAARLECKTTERQLSDAGLLYLGQEPFIVGIRFKEVETRQPEKQPDVESNTVAGSSTKVFYQCNELSCGFQSAEYHESCPQCSCFGSMRKMVDRS